MGAGRRIKTKRRTRDYDQILHDLSIPSHLSKYKSTKEPSDLPAGGTHYCTPCAKWFEDEHNLVHHRKGKNHKRRLKYLEEEREVRGKGEWIAGLRRDDDGGRDGRELPLEVKEVEAKEVEMVVGDEVGGEKEVEVVDDADLIL